MGTREEREFNVYFFVCVLLRWKWGWRLVKWVITQGKTRRNQNVNLKSQRCFDVKLRFNYVLCFPGRSIMSLAISYFDLICLVPVEGCPPGWHLIGPYCRKVIDTPMTVPAAKSYCYRTNNGQLWSDICMLNTHSFQSLMDEM